MCDLDLSSRRPAAVGFNRTVSFLPPATVPLRFATVTVRRPFFAVSLIVKRHEVPAAAVHFSGTLTTRLRTFALLAASRAAAAVVVGGAVGDGTATGASAPVPVPVTALLPMRLPLSQLSARSANAAPAPWTTWSVK